MVEWENAQSRRSPQAHEENDARRFHAARRDPQLTVLEGIHALKHALRFGADVLEARTGDADALARLAPTLAGDVSARMLELARPVPLATFRALAPGPVRDVIAIARRPAFALPRADVPMPVVLLEEPTHHGNVGAAVRVAAAAGAAAVVTTGPLDPWHPAALRGAAGLHYALPVGRLDASAQLDALLEARPLVAIDPEGEPLREPLPVAGTLAFGSERRGLSESLLRRATRRVRIPMRALVSSLNLATAVAVTLYAGYPGSAGRD